MTLVHRCGAAGPRHPQDDLLSQGLIFHPAFLLLPFSHVSPAGSIKMADDPRRLGEEGRVLLGRSVILFKYAVHIMAKNLSARNWTSCLEVYFRSTFLTFNSFLILFGSFLL